MAKLVPIPQQRDITFSDQVVDELCERLSKGELLTHICRDAHMPSALTVWGWSKNRAALSERLASARVAGIDAIAEETIAIADGQRALTGARDVVGEPATRDRLRVETRLKLLARWDPSRYGESTQLRLADADGNKLDAKPAITELLQVLKPPIQET